MSSLSIRALQWQDVHVARADMNGVVATARTRRSPYVTMDDVAREAGVSRALVSLVMRQSDKVSPQRRELVLDTARRLGYRPNANARSLASHRTDTVGVLLNDLHNPFFAEIANGIEDLASDLGYRLLIITGGRREQRERAMLEALLEYRTDGLILVSPRMTGTQIAAAVAGIPCVVVGRRLRGGIDCVMTDEGGGAHLAVEHLAGAGPRADRARRRRSGRRRGPAPRGLRQGDGGGRAPAADDGHPGRVHRGRRDRARQRGCWRGAELPTAVFAANDLVALGLIDRLEQDGVRIPEDVSVVGYDNTFIAALNHIQLTTINQPRHEMGREALQLVLERGEGRTKAATRLHQPVLVERSTTTAPR